MRPLVKRDRAAAGFGDFDFLKREAAVRIADRLELMRRDFPLCLDFGCHDGTLTREIRATGKIGTVIQADPAAHRVDQLELVDMGQVLPQEPPLGDLAASQ